ncbi:thiolase family protein [Aeromicrobium alkaliterrae]|uniref:Acetyl-CoA C-acetyltransferase n=1 Tax=Aeromicrobium alkaliterrae TaxID=302168 RepID=A0ABP4W6D5_9ACTN
MGEAFVYDAIRTPRARVRRDGGTLAGVPSYDLLAHLLRELAHRGLPPEVVDDVVIGVSTTVGEQAGDLARVAVMRAAWPDETPAGVVSRLCCSGLDAIASGAGQVRSGMADVVVVGGAESMSRTPMMSDQPAFALQDELGESTGFVTIGVAADATAVKHGFGRAELDAFAVRSHVRAAAAEWACVVPIEVDGHLLDRDEGARPDVTTESLAQLPALFSTDPLWERVERRLPGFERPATGLHTVATAPQMCDGASAAVIGSAQAAETLGRAPLARVAGWAHVAVRSPSLDGTVAAARTALTRAGITAGDLAVAELNESFATTPLLLARELDLDDDVVNVQGGAVAVGHPLGASGGMLLAHATELLGRRGGGYGLLVIPGALGVATAIVIEGLGAAA